VTAMMTTPLLLVATPVLGATLGLLIMWSKPQALKVWLLLAAMISLGTVGWVSGSLRVQAGGLPLLSLLPLTAFVTLLGQPAHRSLCAAWLLTLLLLGLGLGVLTCEAPLSLIFFLFLLALIGLMLFYFRRQGGFETWWGIGTVGLGMVGVIVAMTVTSPVSYIAVALACAIGLPLVPFHKSYVAALTGLPGNLPAFLALLLPVIGFHGLLTVLPQFPNVLAEAAGILALMGMLYGSLKALAQSRAASIMAYGSLAFFSILWWYLVTTRTATPQTVVYLSAVGLATSGLLLAWYVLRARYGEIGFRALSGLAEPMPRFAVVLSLLALAALGLPPFGVFSGFIGMLLAPLFTWSSGLIVIIIAWLTASWYFFDLVQGLLFGCRRLDRRHADLRVPELTSLAIVLILLVALGVMPSRFFASGPATLDRAVVTERPAWNK
jgi:NADH-quinone oxidoreductase subunit M